MANDSFYKREAEYKDAKEQEKVNISVNLAGPLGFWIGILLIATLIQLVFIPIAIAYNSATFNPYLNSFAEYAIYMPGVIVLPLIASVWIGERVSGSFGDKKKGILVSKSLINALYSILVYAVTIFIIYIVMRFLNAGVLAGMDPLSFVEYMIAVPFVISMVIIPLFALLSAARHYS